MGEERSEAGQKKEKEEGITGALSGTWPGEETMFALRLSTDLILRSPQFMNACDEYELDLRGNKVSVIENLGGTQNQFDSIDLSDNEIVKLEGFPLLPRLKTLTLNHNRISRISKNLEASIPNLETLVLTGNRINSIEDLQNLRELSKLKRLVVLDNEITKLPDYRLQIMKLLPQLRMVDFKRAAAILASEDVEMADSCPCILPLGAQACSTKK